MTAASAAVVKDGIVQNLIVVDIDANRKTEFSMPQVDLVVLSDGDRVNIGDVYENGLFWRREEPAKAPEDQVYVPPGEFPVPENDSDQLEFPLPE